jgi:methyl-accepting chemotaxis protein
MSFRLSVRPSPNAAAHPHQQIAAIDTGMARIEFDPDGRIRDANENFLKALGYSLADIVGRHHRMFVTQEDRDSEAYRTFWNRLAGGESFSGEFCRVTRSGAPIYIEAIYAPIRDEQGRVTGVLKVANDVTERANQRRLNAALIEAIGATSAIIEFKPDGTVISCNQNFLSAVGYRAEEIVGRHHRMFCRETYRASEDYRAFWDALNRGFPFSGEFERVNKSGEPV